VIHLAGVVDDGVLAGQTWDRFSAVLGPKVAGGWTMHDLAASSGARHLILFSSAAAILGSPAQSAYAAANAFLDALAGFRRARGLPAVSINWGAWAEAGMAARVEASGKRRVLGELRPMTPEQCLNALPALLAGGTHHAAVIAFDRDKLDGESGRRLRTLLGAGSTPSSQPVESAPARPFGESLSTLPRPRARALVLDHLRQLTTGVLGLSPTHFVDEHQPLMKIGLDSLMALELRNKVGESFGRSFSATLLFDHPTLAALADLLVPPVSPVPVVEQRDELLDDIEALSDEEAERLLAHDLDAGSRA
jgi:aryl carrier-like protein